MSIDRQAIERRDFPISRRGYEPAAVDSHLRTLADELEQLQRERLDGGSEPSLAATAGTQVQSILAAAEAAAAEIERQARDGAKTAREDAERDASSTREQAIEQARAHVAAVAAATAVLLERVGSLDGEVSALVESLRSGAGRLAGDLAAVETNMGELYDAASGQWVTRAVAGEPAPQPAIPSPPPPPGPRPTAPGAPASSGPPATATGAPVPPQQPPASGAAAPSVRPAQSAPPPLSPADTVEPDVHVDPEAPAAGNGGDLDSARLVALNMALNGESRAETDRYLAENFQLADRQKLVDEVYAAIES